MRLASVVRAAQVGAVDRQVDDRLDMELDRIRAWAEVADVDPDRLIQRLLDGEEPNERYFEGAHPS